MDTAINTYCLTGSGSTVVFGATIMMLVFFIFGILFAACADNQTGYGPRVIHKYFIAAVISFLIGSNMVLLIIFLLY